ncbi:MAG: hypothetical protein ACYSOF_06730 [Planctomycetota bacterium]
MPKGLSLLEGLRWVGWHSEVFALGLLSFGGVGLGLLAAFGGVAISGGFASGGLAIGFVAIGGCAIGYYAIGGGAFGVHALGGNAQDSGLKAFFESLTRCAS